MKRINPAKPLRRARLALPPDPVIVTKMPIALLCKLGSVVVHVDEALSADGHEFDIVALRGLVNDPEVRDWVERMGAKGFLPVKRSK